MPRVPCPRPDSDEAEFWGSAYFSHAQFLEEAPGPRPDNDEAEFWSPAYFSHAQFLEEAPGSRPRTRPRRERDPGLRPIPTRCPYDQSSGYPLASGSRRQARMPTLMATPSAADPGARCDDSYPLASGARHQARMPTLIGTPSAADPGARRGAVRAEERSCLVAQ